MAARIAEIEPEMAELLAPLTAGSKIDTLNQQINEEIAKKNTDVKKLVADIRLRRRELAQEKRDQSGAAVKLKDLSSNSHVGKSIEHTVCRRFKAVHENNKDRQEMKKNNTKMSLEHITGKLAKESN